MVVDDEASIVVLIDRPGRRANPSSSAFASFRSSVSKPPVNRPYTGASSSRACCATSRGGASGPRRQAVTLIPDRDGVAARHVLRLRLRQLRSPPTRCSRAPSACASALGVPCTSTLHCPDCDRIAPVRGHYWAGASKRSIARGSHAYDADSLIQVQDNAHVWQSVTLPQCALLTKHSTA